MALTITEEVLLLTLDDVKGKPLVDGTALDAGLAGAAIVELTLDGALRLTEVDEPEAKKGRLVATGHTPSDPRLAGLIEPANGRTPKNAISKVMGWSWGPNRSQKLKEGVLSDLAERGLLVEENGKVLGLFPTTAWKQGTRSEHEREALQRVRRVVVQNKHADARTAAIASVLHAMGVLPKLFPEQDKKTLKARGTQISESGWAGPAVTKAVQEIQAAIVTTVVIASVGPAAGSS